MKLDAKDQSDLAARERVKGFERTKRVLSYHIYRLHRKAKRYSENAKDEERYYKALKSLGYLSQVLIVAQKSIFDEELSIVEGAMKEVERMREEHSRLKRIEEAYNKLISAGSAKEGGP